MRLFEIDMFDERIKAIQSNARRVAFQFGILLFMPVLMVYQKPPGEHFLFVIELIAIAAAIATATWFGLRLINSAKRYVVPVEVFGTPEPGTLPRDDTSGAMLCIFIGLIFFVNEFEITQPLTDNVRAFVILGVFLVFSYIADRFFMNPGQYKHAHRGVAKSENGAP